MPNNQTNAGTSQHSENQFANVCAPSEFNFSQPQSWPQWKKRFGRYLSVSGLSNKTDKEKVDILIYLMGNEAEEILLQYNLSGQETYDEILTRFDTHFIPKRNIIFERFQFNSRVQLPGEPVENFIISLHTLAEHCNYGTLKEELIRDRIVIGVADTKVSERLQLKDSLTLQEAINVVRQSEMQNSQNKILRQSPSVNLIKHNTQQNFKNKSPSNKVQEQLQNKKCSFCGIPTCVGKEKCPARKSICRACNKRGHWSVVCRSKNSSVRAVEYMNSKSSEEPEEEFEVKQVTKAQDVLQKNNFIGQVYLDNKQRWYVDILLDHKYKVPFFVDSGADVTCFPYENLPKQFIDKLVKCNSVGAADNHQLDTVGKIKIKLTYDDVTRVENVYVIRKLRQPILGRNAIIKFNVLNFSKKNVKLVNQIQYGVVCNVNQTQGSSARNEKLSKFNLDIITKLFPDIFSEIGEFKTEMSLQIKSDARPFVQSVPRTVPLALLPKLKTEIDRLLKLGIIEPIESPTTWVSPIVVIDKGDTVRLCCDYTKLNPSVLRSHFPLPKVEHTLAQLKGSNFFTKLDTTSGFYQIKLDRESQLLTTFITPYGRFYFKRLPFGISCAPEYFAMNFSKILAGIEGCVYHMDDILIHASTVERHDEILNRVLSKLHQEGITLNRKKCVVASQSVKYLGHVISKQGISVDPDRVRAIRDFPNPVDKTELLRLLGMINFAARYINNKSEILEPLTSLLKKDVLFLWGPLQERAFGQIKKLLESPPNLAFFDANKTIIVSADASSFGIGSCLMQENYDKTGNREIVAFASRLLSSPETRYAQIEKEALALTWAAEYFSDYITGVPVLVFETDHKPLLQILQTKNLDDLTPRLQRFRMRLMRYKYTVIYTPGKNLVVPDALSRNPLESQQFGQEELTAEIDSYVQSVVKNLPVKDYFLEIIKKEQEKDSICVKLKEYSVTSWPDKSKLPVQMLPYYQYRHEISFSENLVLKGTRIVVPKDLQLKCLDFIHTGHLGIVKCRERAKSSVWWLGLSSQIECLVKTCPNCVENRENIRETFIRDETATRPWQKVAVDLFKCLEKWYVIITDYYSRWFDIFLLSSLTEEAVIVKLKECFSRYGIPESVRSDNGPQFSSQFHNFAKNYHFRHVRSSPYWSQGNGGVERAVQTAKRLIKKNKNDLFLALLAYRCTPLDCGFTPAELLMNRKLRSNLPQLPSVLENNLNLKSEFSFKERENKDKQERNYNKRHKTKDMDPLNVGDSVWVVDIRKYGKVVEICDEPRSYVVETDSGKFRRNRWHLIRAPYYFPNAQTEFITEYASSNNNCKHRENLFVDSQNDTSLPRESDSETRETVVETDSSLDSEVNSPGPSRPKRTVRKPAFLDDYILSPIVL